MPSSVSEPFEERKQAIEVAVSVLNSAYAADPAAIHALICNRVPCNLALADHPTIPVETNRVATGETFSVGALGLVNGVLEAICGKRVAVQFSNEKDERGAHRIVGFQEYAPQHEQKVVE